MSIEYYSLLSLALDFLLVTPPFLLDLALV